MHKDSEQELFEEQVNQMTRLADREVLSILAMSPEEHRELHKAIHSLNPLSQLVKLSDSRNDNF